jgi:MFS family permease
VDWVGGLLYALGILSILLGVSQGGTWGWESGAVVGLFVIGPLLLVACCSYELRVRAPMIDVKLVRHRPVWTLYATSVVACGAFFAMFLIVPKIAQAPVSTGYGLGVSAGSASLLMVPLSIGAMLASASSSLVVPRFGSRRMILIGIGLGGAAYLLLAAAPGSPLALIAATACDGAGIGSITASSATLLSIVVPQTQIGEANGMAAMSRNVGAVFSSTIMAAVLAASLIPGLGLPTESAFRTVYGIALAFVGVAAVLCLKIPDVRLASRSLPVPASAGIEPL